MNKFWQLIDIADIHANRLTMALEKLKGVFPISPIAVEKMQDEQLLLTEMLTSRFAKLQDFIGNKLVDAFLGLKGEVTANLSMIDKLNKLERLDIIFSSENWLKSRELRNHLAQEYPGHPEITAKFLNEVYQMAPDLLSLFKNMKDKAS